MQITKLMLDIYFGGVAKDSGNSFQVKLKKRGPGYLDQTALMLNNNDNIWKIFENQKTNSQGKPIIFSDDIFGRLGAKPDEIAYINSLIEYGDFYLWQGKDAELLNTRPLQDGAEFWANRHRIVKADANEVKTQLADQSLTADDYHILDYAATKSLFDFIHVASQHVMSSKEYLLCAKNNTYPENLYWAAYSVISPLAVNLDQYRSLFNDKDLAELTEVILDMPKDDIYDLLGKLPNLQKLTLVNCSIDWCNANFPNLPQNISITISIPHESTNKILQIPNSIRLVNLTLKGEITEIDIASTKAAPGRIDFLKIDSNKPYIFTQKAPFEITTISSSCIRYANFQDCMLKRFDYSPKSDIGFNRRYVLPKDLINLRIAYTDLPASYVEQFKSLRYLYANLVSDEDEIIIKNYELESLVLQEAFNPLMEEPHVLKSYEVSHSKQYLAHEGSENTGYIQFENLEHLSVSNYSGKKITSEHIPHSVQDLKITFCNGLKLIDLESLEQLRDFNLLHMNPIDHIKLPDKLVNINIQATSSISNLDIPFNPHVKSLEFNNSTHPLNLQNIPNVESLKLKTLDCIATDEIPYLKHLHTLHIASYKNATLKISNSNLKHLQCNFGYTKLTESAISIDIAEIPSLQSLILQSTEAEHLKIYNLGNSLKEIEIRNCKHRVLDLSEAKDLEVLSLSIESLETLLLPINNKIKYIYYNSSKPSSNMNHEIINNIFRTCPELEVINITATFPTTIIDCSPAQNLRSLLYKSKGYFSSDENKNENKLHIMFNFTNCKLLNTLDISNHFNNTTIDVADCSSLSNFKCNSVNGHINVHGVDTLINLTSVETMSFNDHECNLLFKEVPVNIRNKVFRSARSHSTNAMAAPDVLKFVERDQNHWQNEASPVSIYKPCQSMDIDTKVEELVNYRANGEFKCVLSSKKGITKNAYRINIFDMIDYQKATDSNYERLSFKNNINQETLKPAQMTEFGVFSVEKYHALKRQIRDDSNKAVGYFEGTLHPGALYALPSITSNISNSIGAFASNADDIDILWNEEHQQFYIKLKDNRDKVQIQLCYMIECESTSKNALQDYLPISTQDLLDPDLKKRLRDYLIGTDLAYLLDEKISDNEKLNRLINFFSSFNSEKNAEKKQSSSFLEDLLSLIAKKSGACRHRAQLFMLLAQFIGVKTRIISNEQHAYNEILVPTKDGMRWLKIDLGGSPVNDLTDVNLRNMVMDKLKINLVDYNAPEPTDNRYRKLFEFQAKVDSLSSFSELLANQNTNSPLCLLPKDKSAFDFEFNLLQYLKAERPDLTEENVIFINKASDFLLFKEPRIFKDGEIIQIPNGPLQGITNNGGIIVINWDNFDENEMATYKSILEKDATILGLTVSSKTKVIGLAHEDKNGCSAFFTRVKRYQVDESLFTTKAQKPTEDPIVINLYESPTWAEKLLGQQDVIDGNKIFVEGPLLQAIKEGRDIVIENPPDDNEYAELITRLANEQKIFFNGKFYIDKTGINIESRYCENNLTLNNLEFTAVDLSAINDEQTWHYIGLHNLKDLILRFKYEDGQAIPLPGVLDIYNPTTDVIYITDDIPKGCWAEMTDWIAMTHPDKLFNFMLAPGIQIEDVAINENIGITLDVPLDPEVELPNEETIFTSNDPDHLVQYLTQKDHENTYVIDVSPDTEVADILYSIDSKQVNGKLHFEFKVASILKHLMDGHNIILNGEISPTLYQYLQPLLTEHPSITANNIVYKPPGKLYCVMPLNTEDKFSLAHNAKCIFDLDYYQRQLLESMPEAQTEIDNVCHFYAFVENLQFKGMGKPNKVQFSYHRLEKMVHTLSKAEPFHKANPLKGLFLYDFPKDSEEYAYLNVMAKICFGNVELTKQQPQKLKKIINRINLDDLQQIEANRFVIMNSLGFNDIDTLIFKHSNYTSEPHKIPRLTEDGLKYLQKLLHEAQQQIVTPKPINRVQKISNYLKEVLDDENKPFIFLKGPAGVGKSHHVRKNIKNYHEGMRHIIDWLSDERPGPKVLLLDEVNLASPGTWDFLKGICRSDKTIFYEGKLYTLSPEHKIIATGNPETYPERSYHQFIQDYAETIYLVRPDDNYLVNNILSPMLAANRLDIEPLMQLLVEGYHLIEKYNPHFLNSIRDLENLTNRFLLLSQDSDDIYHAASEAIVSEFSGCIRESKMRMAFMDDVESLVNKISPNVQIEQNLRHVNQSEIIHIAKDHYIPKEKQYLVKAIAQDFHLREQVLENKTAGFTKSAILLEGDSGLGKSTLYKMMIRNQINENLERYDLHFSQDMVDKHLALHNQCQGMEQLQLIEHDISQSLFEEFKLQEFEIQNYLTTLKKYRYLELSAGDHSIYEDLKRAFHEGMIVILDELNLDEHIEGLLNQLLTGVDEHGEPAKNPGFLILTSQNPGFFAGRKNLSVALKNRTHFLYMDNYSDSELSAIASTKVDDSDEMIEAYKEVGAKHKHVNSRTFFNVFNALDLPTRDRSQELGEQQAKRRKY